MEFPKPLFVFPHNKKQKKGLLMKYLSMLTLALLFTGASAQAQINGKTIQEGIATSINDPLTGKVVNVLGDSYVQNHRRPYQETWHYLVARNHGMKYNNYGRNGGCVAFDRSKEGFGPSLLVRYKQMDPTADLVVIIAGHNDADKIKLSKDSLRLFSDAASALIDSIHSLCPKAQIAWVTPWYVGRDGFKETVKEIKRVCKRKHAAVLDNYSPKSIIQVRNDDFRKQYFQGTNDTAHLNAEGHKLFLPTGDSFIRKVMK